MTYGVIVRHGEQNADYEEFRDLPSAEAYYKEKVSKIRLSRLPAPSRTDEDAGKEIRIPVFITFYKARCLRSYSVEDYGSYLSPATGEEVIEKVRVKIQLYQY